MVHAYHVILPCYGVWLPNDPRGSWTDYIARWELARAFLPDPRRKGSPPEKKFADLTDAERQELEQAQANLMYPPVIFNGRQARSISWGFEERLQRSRYSIWACSILPQHSHLVIARHRYKIETVVNLLKGSATSRLIKDGNHPLSRYAKPNRRPPRMWARKHWKIFLDNESAIENAIAYVIDNPIREGKPQQQWKWLTPYRGLEAGWTTYLT